MAARPLRLAAFPSGTLTVLLLTLTILPACAHGAGTQRMPVATARDVPAVALPRTQQYDLVSNVNGRSYRLHVAVPVGYAVGDTTRYPVLYLLDSYLTFLRDLGLPTGRVLCGDHADRALVKLRAAKSALAEPGLPPTPEGAYP